MVSFMAPADIEQAAIDLAVQYPRAGTVPVPVEEILEFDLDIIISPLANLMDGFNIDAMFSRDFTQLYIDEHQFTNIENRARFTLAHELGHYVLHREYVAGLNFESQADWEKFITTDIKRNNMETQANMFASYLLMPTAELAVQFENQKNELLNHPGFADKGLPDDSTLAPYLAKPLATTFKVSEESATWRVLQWIKTND